MYTQAGSSGHTSAFLEKTLALPCRMYPQRQAMMLSAETPPQSAPLLCPHASSVALAFFIAFLMARPFIALPTFFAFFMAAFIAAAFFMPDFFMAAFIAA